MLLWKDDRILSVIINPVSSQIPGVVFLLSPFFFVGIRIREDALNLCLGSADWFEQHYFAKERFGLITTLQRQQQPPKEYLTNKSEAQAKAISCIAIRLL